MAAQNERIFQSMVAAYGVMFELRVNSPIYGQFKSDAMWTFGFVDIKVRYNEISFNVIQQMRTNERSIQ